MNPWKPESLTRRFENEADRAERYMLECKDKVSRSEHYKVLHDEHLAKFYVFNYLHGRDFLETPELFHAELKRFLNYQETAPSEAFDGNCFLDYRRKYIQGLIAEVEKAWPALK